MAKTPLLGHKNSKMSLKKLHIIIVNRSALLLTTDKNKGHARICEIYEIYNNYKFDYKQIKHLIFQIKEQACPMGGRMLTYHTQVTVNITRLLLHNCDYLYQIISDNIRFELLQIANFNLFFIIFQAKVPRILCLSNNV